MFPLVVIPTLISPKANVTGDGVLCCVNVMFLMAELVNEILMLFTMLVSNKTSMISKNRKKDYYYRNSIVLNFPEFLFPNLQFYISGVVLEWMNG